MTHSVDLAGEEGGHVVQVVVDAPHLEGSGLAIAPVVWIKKRGNLFFGSFSLFSNFRGSILSTKFCLYHRKRLSLRAHYNKQDVVISGGELISMKQFN